MDIEKLEKLHELKEKGILSQEEFDIQKNIIMREKITTNVYNVPQKNNSGVLIALLCCLMIAVLLVVGHVFVAKPYLLNKEADKEVNNMEMLVANIRTLFSSQDNYEGLNNSTAKKFGVVPKDMYESEDDDVIKNSFGKDVSIDNVYCYGWEARCFEIVSKGVSKEACEKMIEKLPQLKYLKVGVINSNDYTNCNGCDSNGCIMGIFAE